MAEVVDAEVVSWLGFLSSGVDWEFGADVVILLSGC